MDVMEEAVRENGHSYHFSTEYVLFMIGVDGVLEQSYGHMVRQIGDVAKNNSCYWAMFVTPPNGAESKINTPVSAFILPGDGHRLTLRWNCKHQLPIVPQDQEPRYIQSKCMATSLAIWCALNGNQKAVHSILLLRNYSDYSVLLTSTVDPLL